MDITSAEDIKALVLMAFYMSLNGPDHAKEAEICSRNCIQHSARILRGRDGLSELVKAAPEAQSAFAGAASIIKEEAQKILAPLYEALNRSARKDVAALLAKAAHPNYRMHHADEESVSCDQWDFCEDRGGGKARCPSARDSGETTPQRIARCSGRALPSRSGFPGGN